MSLRGGRRPTWQSREGSYVFADGFPVIRHCPARFPRRFAPRNDTSGWCSGTPVPLYSLISLHKALTTCKGHAASVRRQSRQRLRSERRYRRNWCIPFYRRLVPTAGASPGAACRSPTNPSPNKKGSCPELSLRAGLFLLCYSAGCAAVVPLSVPPFSRADISNIGSVAPSPVINVGSSPFQFSA